MSSPLFFRQYLILILLLDINLSFILRDLKIYISFSEYKCSFISVLIRRVSFLSHIFSTKKSLGDNNGGELKV